MQFNTLKGEIGFIVSWLCCQPLLYEAFEN